MSKSLVITTILALMLFVSGCGTQSSTTSSDKTPFIGGNDGLVIDFMDGAPPSEVYDGGGYPFEVALRIQNKGEHDVPLGEAIIKVTGIDPDDFAVAPSELVKNPDEDLLGSMKDSDGNLIDGTTSYLSFGEFNYAGALSGNTPFTFRADVCYTYETMATTKLCVIEDVLDFDSDTVCDVDEVKTVFNSGGPIQITSFEQSPMGQDSLTFSFEVSHTGLGQIFGPDSECDNTVTNEDKVFIEVDTGIEGHPADCSGLGGGPSGTVSLYGGEKRTFRCNQDVTGASTNYEKVITIRARYDYQQSTSKTLLVKHAS